MRAQSAGASAPLAVEQGARRHTLSWEVHVGLHQEQVLWVRRPPSIMNPVQSSSSHTNHVCQHVWLLLPACGATPMRQAEGGTAVQQHETSTTTLSNTITHTEEVSSTTMETISRPSKPALSRFASSACFESPLPCAAGAMGNALRERGRGTHSWALCFAGKAAEAVRG